jgi:hypothetical protein
MSAVACNLGQHQKDAFVAKKHIHMQSYTCTFHICVYKHIIIYIYIYTTQYIYIYIYTIYNIYTILYIIYNIFECILDTSTHGESSVAIRISSRSFVIPGFGRMPVRARRGFTMDSPWIFPWIILVYLGVSFRLQNF